MATKQTAPRFIKGTAKSRATSSDYMAAKQKVLLTVFSNGAADSLNSTVFAPKNFALIKP